ncbi:MAG: prenyltransferase [Acidobacteriota bacterium]
MITNKVAAWFSLSRPPFHSVGILPFILGGLLAWYETGHLNWLILGLGTLAVVLIMLATYYSGEYFDYETDILSAKLERNQFSGGTQVLQTGIIPKKHAFFASILSLLLAAGVGLLLQFYCRTGIYTIPLGALGMFAGFFYSISPIQWAYRGVGEIWIGFSYGWLVVAASYYIQTGKLSPLVHWTSLPIAFTIFNVILINEFPDYPADQRVGKRNLVVRFGRERMSKLYTSISITDWISYLLSIRAGIPIKALFFFSPIFLLSLLTTLQVLRGAYNDPKKLEGICAKTLIVNLGTTISLILAISL